MMAQAICAWRYRIKKLTNISLCNSWEFHLHFFQNPLRTNDIHLCYKRKSDVNILAMMHENAVFRLEYWSKMQDNYQESADK